MVIAALLAAASVLVLIPPSPRSRLHATAATESASPEHRSSERSTPERSTPERSRALVAMAVVGAVGVGMVVGGAPGVVAGIASGGVGLWLLRHAPEATGDDAAVARVVPQVTDLLAATIAAGAAPPAAIEATARAVGGAAGAALHRTYAALALGATAPEAWRRAGPAFAPVGVTFTRSAQSGAALATVLAALADDIRRERRLAVDIAARAAGVKAVAPLVVCFLPAFVLIGVVPIVVSLASELLG